MYCGAASKLDTKIHTNKRVKCYLYKSRNSFCLFFFFATLTKIFILSSKCYSVTESFIEVGLYGIKEVCRVDIVFI